jgi:hypothetical protein
MRGPRLFATILAGAVCLAGASAAAPFVDAATGLKVDPPQPFVVAPAKSQTYDVAVVVNSLTGAPSLGAGDNYLCQIGYKGLPDNADFDQEEINLQVEQPDWLDNVAAAMSQTFEVTGKATFVLDGATGVELIGKPRDPTHAASVFVSMVDTPKGRTTVNCATRPEEIDAAVNQFRLIRASVTLPGTKAQ